MRLSQYLANAAQVATILLPGLVYAGDPNLGAVLNLVYGSNEGPDFNVSKEDILTYIKMAQPSAVVPFMLNVKPPYLHQYSHILTELQNAGIKVYPAIGDYKKTPDLSDYKAAAKAYTQYTDCIQLDQVGKYIQDKETGLQGLLSFIDYLNKTLHYQHIMLNAWPKEKSNVDYTFENPAVDSAIEEVQYNDAPHAASAWTPNVKRYERILKAQPGVTIITNYENPTEERILAGLSTKKNLQIFKKTINAIKTDFPDGNVHWTAPWSKNYSPLMKDTYSFIVKQLSSGNT